MSLQLVSTSSHKVLSPDALAALGAAVRAAGRAVLLVPSFQLGLEAQRELAATDGLSLGVTVTTPAAWVRERWEVWGDGRSLVGDAARAALVHMVVQTAPEGTCGGLSLTAGTSSDLYDLVRDALAWLPLSGSGPDESDPRTMWLSPGERSMLRLAASYGHALSSRGMVEPCRAARMLPEVLEQEGASCPPMVVTGFSSMGTRDRWIVTEMSRLTQVTVVACEAPGPAGALARTLLGELEEAAARLRIEAVRTGGPHGDKDVPQNVLDGRTPPDAAPVEQELLQLSERVFRAGEFPEPLHPMGAVRRLEAAGPLAEAGLVAADVARMVAGGARLVVVVVPDTSRAWAELAPKLVAQGLLVRSSVQVRLDRMPAAHAFLGWAKLVARLVATEEPPVQETEFGPIQPVGDMTWWPPRAFTDFLISDVTTVSVTRAWSLDAKWRGDRRLTPSEALDSLMRESSTSRGVARAMDALLKGRVGTAADILRRDLAAASQGKAPSVARQEAMDVLAMITQLGRDMGSVGISYVDSNPDASYACDLVALVDALEDVMGREGLARRMELGPQDAPCEVRIVSRGEATNLPARSADGVVCCGLTSAEYPLAPDDGALVALLDKLDLSQAADPLDRARAQFSAACGLPRRWLSLEWAARDAESAQTYPAVVATELLACYGVGPKGQVDAQARPSLAPLVAHARSEALVGENLSAAGVAPEPCATEEVPPAGELADASRPYVLVPRMGDDGFPQGVPELSATQIESYLECPYKWFTLRRLGLSDLDADFSAVQAGTFVHRVLEETRGRLIEEAAAAAGLAPAPAPLGPREKGAPVFDQFSFGPDYLAGARVDADPAHAREVLDYYFREHMAHQYQHGRSLRDQSLVPHTATEEYRLARMEQDLLVELGFETTGVLEGFSPRYLELRFGGSGRGAKYMEYAGVSLNGRVDRIDVDAHGNAVVIDYKHKGGQSFCREHDAFGDDGCPAPGDLVLPRRVQTLIYAQVVRRMFPDLNVVGAVYLCTQGQRVRDHAIAGTVEANLADRVMGTTSERRLTHVAVGGQMGFSDLLDEVERKVADRLAQLLAGRIPTEPCDEGACSWCPVQRCERRDGDVR